MTFREVLKRLGMWNKAQKETYKQLASMTDKELLDIGLNRGDIMRLIKEMGENNDG